MGLKIFKRPCVATETHVPDKEKLQRKTGRRGIISFLGGKATRTNRPSPSKEAVKALGGKYISKKNASLRSFDSVEPTEMSISWKSCEAPEYQKRPQVPYKELQAEWGKAIVDARRLPRTAQFANNHIMVNTERTKRAVPALKRSSDLDAIARWHAETMAAETTVRHSDARELQSKLDGPCNHLGSNVATGESIRVIHNEMIHNKGDLRNMTDRRYKQMGMATSRGSDGQLYLCQIFRG